MFITNVWGKNKTLNYIYNMIPINGNTDYVVGAEEPKQNLDKLFFLNGWFPTVVFKAVYVFKFKTSLELTRNVP